MKTPHKHAAILRAIADGVPFERIEICHYKNGWQPYDTSDEMYLIGQYSDKAEFRIKPEETVHYANVYHDIVGTYRRKKEHADSDTRADSRLGVIKITTRDDGTFEVEKA